MTTYAVFDPYDVRPLEKNRKPRMKRVGEAVVRPATAAEWAQFAPLHQALKEQAERCREVHKAHRERQEAEMRQMTELLDPYVPFERWSRANGYADVMDCAPEHVDLARLDAAVAAYTAAEKGAGR